MDGQIDCGRHEAAARLARRQESGKIPKSEEEDADVTYERNTMVISPDAGAHEGASRCF
jgi:hypothetical protein